MIRLMSFPAAAACALGILLTGPAHAQPVHDTVRNGLIFIEMKGETDNGTKIGSQGTGFFVSPDGYILTSYHLLDTISKSRPDKVEIWISVWDRKEPPERKAFVVDARPNLDLLLLKVPRAQQPYNALKIGATQDSLSTVLVSGFIYRDNPPSATYKRYTDQVTSTDGPAGYTWVLNTPAEAGQSGSPVYTSDGTVVGVLKGQFGNQTVFVPIEHARTLLLGIAKTAGDEGANLATSLTSEPAKLALKEWFKSFLRSEGTALIEAEVEEYYKSKTNRERLDRNIEARLDQYMNRVVAYSYSTSFDLRWDKKTHNIGFFKTNDDTGQVSCEALYPTNLVKNKIMAQFNDRREPLYFSLLDDEGGKKSQWFRQLPADNNLMFEPPPAGVAKSNKVTPDQKIKFVVEDNKKFDGTIRVDCTILIIGPAKAPGQYVAGGGQ
jgi:hypothetical protein